MNRVNLSLSHLGSRSKFLHLERQNRPSFGTSVSIVASDELNEVVCDTARQAFSEAPLVVSSHLVMETQVYLLDSSKGVGATSLGSGRPVCVLISHAVLL